MANTPLNTKLGREFRLYVAKTAPKTDGTKTADADFVRVTNENDLGYKATVATTDVNMKENDGQVATLTGSTSYEITTEAARVYTDAGLPLVVGSLGKNWEYQIRYVKSGEAETVFLEGIFLNTEADHQFAADGASTISLTLKGAGAVTENLEPRPLEA